MHIHEIRHELTPTYTHNTVPLFPPSPSFSPSPLPPSFPPSSDPWYICSGGYPEESHSCPKTITIRHGKSLSLLSTNSTIVDFLSLPSSPFATDPQKPLALVILTKDELVVHDLQTEKYVYMYVHVSGVFLL